MPSTPEPAPALAIAPPLPAATRTHPVWLRVGTLVDGFSTDARRDAHIVYDAERIRHVSTGDAEPPVHTRRPGQREPDAHLPDHTLLPGLTEAHAHLFLEGGELDVDERAAFLRQPPEGMLPPAHERLTRMLILGITAIRDAGDRHGVGLALARSCREQQARGSSGPPLPYYESPGAAIHHQGRYGSFMADPLEQHATPRACVEQRVVLGADRIKLIPTGIINFKQGAVTAPPQMSVDEISALVAAAHEFGRQTFAHASGDDGIQRAITGGVESIEHGFFIRPDQLAQLRDRQIAWVPTFAPVQAQLDHAERLGWDAAVQDHLWRILDAHAASLVRAHALGVIIVAGSDAGSYGVPHGLGLYRELELMELAGLPSIAVINAATGSGARRLAFRERVGVIAPEYRPRFLLTRHSPLITVANLRKSLTVVFDGNVYENGAGVQSAGL